LRTRFQLSSLLKIPPEPEFARLQEISVESMQLKDSLNEGIGAAPASSSPSTGS
jgi:hypothetical protein